MPPLLMVVAVAVAALPLLMVTAMVVLVAPVVAVVAVVAVAFMQMQIINSRRCRPWCSTPCLGWSDAQSSRRSATSGAGW